MRQISRRALLYTEMVVAKALIHNPHKGYFLDFNPIEKRISLKVGGDDPKLLLEAGKLAKEWGYDAITLNVGCPSKRVIAGNFCACLIEVFAVSI